MSWFRKTFDRLRGKPHLSENGSKTASASGKPKKPSARQKRVIRTISAKDRAAKAESFTDHSDDAVPEGQILYIKDDEAGNFGADALLFANGNAQILRRTGRRKGYRIIPKATPEWTRLINFLAANLNLFDPIVRSQIQEWIHEEACIGVRKAGEET